jgi:hypothetical protein
VSLRPQTPVALANGDERWGDVVEDEQWVAIERAGWLEPAPVHQAVGMVIAQLGVTSDDALARLREQAARCDRPLLEVAESVISRRLRWVDA